MREKLAKAILISFLVVLAVMVMIYCFSAESGERSSRTSGVFTRAVIDLLYPDYRTYSSAEQKAIRLRVSLAVRKTAHFVEFSMLGCALMRFFICLGRKRPLRRPALYSLLIGVLYACSDELHQHFVSGRGSSIRDVAIDALGVLCGLAAARLFFLTKEKKKEQG